VERVVAPVLLIHGSDDRVVSPRQSEIMKQALERAGKNVKLVIYDGSDHSLGGPPVRARAFTEIEAFLAKSLSGSK